MNNYEKAIEYLEREKNKLHKNHEGCALSKETLIEHAQKRELLEFIENCVLAVQNADKNWNGEKTDANL